MLNIQYRADDFKCGKKLNGFNKIVLHDNLHWVEPVNMLSAWEIRRSQDTRFGASGRKESPATMVSIIFVILSSYY